MRGSTVYHNMKAVQWPRTWVCTNNKNLLVTSTMWSQIFSFLNLKWKKKRIPGCLTVLLMNNYTHLHVHVHVCKSSGLHMCIRCTQHTHTAHTAHTVIKCTGTVYNTGWKVATGWFEKWVYCIAHSCTGCFGYLCVLSSFLHRRWWSMYHRAPVLQQFDSHGGIGPPQKTPRLPLQGTL